MNDKKESKTERATGGYRPLNEGYQPKYVKKGYKPAGQEDATPPKPPKGGTGQSSEKKSEEGDVDSESNM